MGNIMNNWKHPSIVAMKGHPFTGKTTLATALANRLRFCLLINLEEILDTISPASEQVAFDILCGLVETQLSLGVSVVIDSLPPSRPHLDRLVSLSNATKLVVVELQIKREDAWRERFEKDRHTVDPRSWEDVTELVNSYDPRFDEPIEGVSRLKLNVDDTVDCHTFAHVIQGLVLSKDDRDEDYDKCIHKQSH